MAGHRYLRLESSVPTRGIKRPGNRAILGGVVDHSVKRSTEDFFDVQWGRPLFGVN